VVPDVDMFDFTVVFGILRQSNSTLIVPFNHPWKLMVNSYLVKPTVHLEIGRGMPNPGGIGKEYKGVGVRVYIFVPLAYPYPYGGYARV
jgi:hypothetical protein